MRSLEKWIVLIVIGMLSINSIVYAASDHEEKIALKTENLELPHGKNDAFSIHESRGSSDDKKGEKPGSDPNLKKGGSLLTDNEPTPIPELEIYAMLLAGLSLLGFLAHRKKAI